MGILRFGEAEAADCCLDAVAGSAPARNMESFMLAPPGTAAASRPPPVVARNCLRSTDLLARELRMPTPQKYPSHPGRITARGIIRFLSGGGSHKIVFGGMNNRGHVKCGSSLKRRANAPTPTGSKPGQSWT